MLNRAAILLKYKQPAVDWINSIDTSDDFLVTLESVNKEKTVYLIDEESAEHLDKMLENNYMIFFENELNNWYLDENVWPNNLTLSLFNKWFDIECHSIIEDLVGTPIIDDEL